MIDPYPQDHRPADIDSVEWDARVRLAAAYRVVHALGWSEVIMNHISLRVPAPEGQEHFLINAYGLLYEEVTASNLLKIDADGHKVGESEWDANPAGFIIHSAIHRSRPDAHAVMHTHSTAGVAVATKAHGLRHDSFYAVQLAGRVAYHDYEGLSLRLGERERLVASLGDKPLLILRNHGLLAVGETVAHAFWDMWRLQRACEMQAMTDAMAGDNMPVSPEITRRNVDDADNFGRGRVAHQMFDAMARRVAMKGLDYAA